ncbi:MAG: discoidin domain-containing protein [Planctomycetota bacterium]
MPSLLRPSFASVLAFGLSALTALPASLAVAEPDHRYQAVLELDPAGFWPLDDGAGQSFRDLSPQANHGVVHHVPWDASRKMLDFTSKYQWLAVPGHARYQTPAMSMGGWVYLRTPVIGTGWSNRFAGLLVFGNDHWHMREGVQLGLRKGEFIDVVSNAKHDVMDTWKFLFEKDGKRVRSGTGDVQLELGQWHHLIYTFEPDTEQPLVSAKPNLALAARVTASNDGGHPTRRPANVADGDDKTQWVVWADAAPTQGSRPWIQLDLPEETQINRVRLVGRQGTYDDFIAGRLVFSDGTQIDIGSLKDGFDALFTPKTVAWVRFEAAGSRGGRPGISEFQLYREDRVVWQEEGVVENRVVSQGVTGTGSLYLNGELISRVEGVIHKPVSAGLHAGNDALWWHQQASKAGSLDGSLRALAWFDRALSPREVEVLRDATQPETRPLTFSEDALVIGDFRFNVQTVGGREVTLDDWASLDTHERRELLQDLESRDVEFAKAHHDALLPILQRALNDWQTRRAAAALLDALATRESRAIAYEVALPLLENALNDHDSGREAVAETALALAELGGLAEPAVGTIADALEQVIERDGERFPRIDDLDRNAMIRALLDIAPDHPHSRKAIARAYAKPLFETIELSDSTHSQLSKHLEDANYLGALRAFKAIPARNRSERFFTERPSGFEGNYTGTASVSGYTYKVGTGIAWQGVEKVEPELYNQLVDELAQDFPSARQWRPDTHPHLYRVPITQVRPDGTEHRIYLEGKHFILDGYDRKTHGWSVFIDELGYIHITGGQHNRPDPNWYIPGTWERMGISRDKDSDDFPAQMYWVSSEPHNIDTLEFVGRRSDPRAIPAEYLNYMVFLQSQKNETILYGRSLAYGYQCWGMFRYDASIKRWVTVGDDPYYIMQSALQHHPDWRGYLHGTIRGGTPKEPAGLRRLVWAWQPPFYNFCRDPWGARFDATGRLHVHMQLTGLNRDGYNRISSVYAWSDDLGQTFYRANGTELKLPLTINPAPEHNAETRAGSTRQWWDLWISLIRDAGYRTPRTSSL